MTTIPCRHVTTTTTPNTITQPLPWNQLPRHPHLPERRVQRIHLPSFPLGQALFNLMASDPFSPQKKPRVKGGRKEIDLLETPSKQTSSHHHPHHPLFETMEYTADKSLVQSCSSRQHADSESKTHSNRDHSHSESESLPHRLQSYGTYSLDTTADSISRWRKLRNCTVTSFWWYFFDSLFTYESLMNQEVVYNGELDTGILHWLPYSSNNGILSC